VLVSDINLYDTYRSAIALESVDGGVLEDVEIRDVYAVNTGNAIFIRLGHRNLKAPVGQVKGVKISNVLVVVPEGKPDLGYEMEGPLVYAPHNIYPASITGLPGHPVQDVRLENVEVVYRGEAHKDTAWFGTDSLEKVPEKESDYPEFSMFGELPAWGLYVRHVRGLLLRNVTMRVRSDFRPAIVFDDVKGLKMQDVHVTGGKILTVR
jgi:hypothetical protein